MEVVREHFDRAWKSVINPTQYKYHLSSLLSPQQHPELHKLQKIDMSVLNDQGKYISALLLKPKTQVTQDAILYFHGNGGTKIQILGVVNHLINQGIALITFDFIGCGNSDKGYLTYGHNQAADAQIVLRQAYKYINVERLTVWGRSMGAVTAINFAYKNPKVVDKLILDSPFRYLQSVVKRVINQQTRMPQMFVNLLTYFIGKQIEERLKFSLFSQDYLQLFKKISTTFSIMFICSQNDTIVPKQEVQKFYQSFKGDKQLLEISESHEEDRSSSMYNLMISWIKRQKNRKNIKLRLYRPIDMTMEEQQVFSIC